MNGFEGTHTTRVQTIRIYLKRRRGCFDYCAEHMRRSCSYVVTYVVSVLDVKYDLIQSNP